MVRRRTQDRRTGRGGYRSPTTDTPLKQGLRTYRVADGQLVPDPAEQRISSQLPRAGPQPLLKPCQGLGVTVCHY